MFNYTHLLINWKLRIKIFLSVFYRAIKHGSELRCVEIQITRPKAEWFNFERLNDYPCFIARKNTGRILVYFDSNIFSSEKVRFIEKIREVSNDDHDVIKAWVFYRRIIHGDVASLFIQGCVRYVLECIFNDGAICYNKVIGL